jgi:hypothetical protein
MGMHGGRAHTTHGGIDLVRVDPLDQLGLARRAQRVQGPQQVKPRHGKEQERHSAQEEARLVEHSYRMAERKTKRHTPAMVLRRIWLGKQIQAARKVPNVAILLEVQDRIRFCQSQ